ncbi:MBL fold metallo-hydrolase [Candidatus Clostridium radicumherbarum]|uniref:MBL fold metallo-hydrolase n=1 Tax=Candidatus Clostridium radicumherbarum TaxID=3381662 RepID=A0ABW8TSG8_9CLOT
MNILKLTCKMTNCYLIESRLGWIMIDTDFPETLNQMLHLIKQYDIKISDIKYLLVTHFHPDHAGFAQDLKNLGVSLVIHECQTPFVKKLNDFFKKNPKFNFTDIILEDNIVINNENSRSFLKDLGIDGDIIQTPGHTDDSISLVIDGYCAFTGDLPEFALMEAYDDETIKNSWELIKERNITKIYPAHGASYMI